MAVGDAPFRAGDDGPEWWNLSEAWRELLFPSDVLLFRSSADKIGSSGNLLLFRSSFNRSSISNRFSISDGVTPVEAMEPEEGGSSSKSGILGLVAVLMRLIRSNGAFELGTGSPARGIADTTGGD